MISERLIVAQNPWWTDPGGWEARDGHLRALALQPVQLPTQVVAGIAVDEAGTHVIRGPRQVGKSTELKLLAQRAMAEGLRPRNIIYLSLDAIDGEPHGEAADTVARACDLSRAEGSAAAPARRGDVHPQVGARRQASVRHRPHSRRCHRVHWLVGRASAAWRQRTTPGPTRARRRSLRGAAILRRVCRRTGLAGSGFAGPQDR